MPSYEPVDAAHLHAYTLGDAALEAEIAVIFRQQAKGLRARIGQNTPRAERLRALHTLKGAAASLGAFELAARCRDAEHVLLENRQAGAARYAIDEVSGALDAVLMYLDHRLARA